MTTCLQRPRLGLCCIFKEQPISFTVRQAAYISRFGRSEQLTKITDSILHNGESLIKAIAFCREAGIGAFRINSRIFPLKTHPQVGYSLEDLPEAEEIEKIFRRAGYLAARDDIRLTFHPDQFTLLSSPDQGVTDRSVAELTYQAEVAELVGAEVIMLHGGGAYGDKAAALARLERTVDLLPTGVRSRLAFENDDRIYTPADLLPVCARTGIPFVYDVHHHRCHPDGLSTEEVTAATLATWQKEPLCHLSSPRDGWNSATPRPHHDFIDIRDFPPSWINLPITIEIEAKAKELAIHKLQQDLAAIISE